MLVPELQEIVNQFVDGNLGWGELGTWRALDTMDLQPLLVCYPAPSPTPCRLFFLITDSYTGLGEVVGQGNLMFSFSSQKGENQRLPWPLGDHLE